MQEPTFLVLTALTGEPLHGYGILQQVTALSGGAVVLGAGTLYGALDRLTEQGLIAVEREEAVDGRLRRYYRLTDEGAGRLAPRWNGCAATPTRPRPACAAAPPAGAGRCRASRESRALGRRYRRLLLAYPAAYRRRHGDELLTTLLDAAGPDRVRPSRRDVVDLVRGGLRQRFRLPVGKAPVAVAVFAAFAFGALGAGTGSFLGWCTTPPLRVDASAAQIAGLAAGEPYVGGFSRDDRWQNRAVRSRPSTPATSAGWTCRRRPGPVRRRRLDRRTRRRSAFIASRGAVRARVAGPGPATPAPGGGSPGRARRRARRRRHLAGRAGGGARRCRGRLARRHRRRLAARRLARLPAARGAVMVPPGRGRHPRGRRDPGAVPPGAVTYPLIGAGALLSPDRWGPPPPVYVGFIDTDAVAVPAGRSRGDRGRLPHRGRCAAHPPAATGPPEVPRRPSYTPTS